MRFAEKSFEVRFCATLTAAAMPFERNPQWFGMTQAQERLSGIDTMLRVGGDLLIFQFKAKRDGKFHLEEFQWRNLARIEKRYPTSTLYVFPEAEDVAASTSPACLLKSSWCCSPADLGQTFRSGAKSTIISLDPRRSCLSKSRPKVTAGARTSCTVFGCFCPPIRVSHKANGATFWLSPNPAPAMDGASPLLSIFNDSRSGIPFGHGVGDHSERPAITSVQQFEEMLGEQAKRDLGRGLFGLFLPRN